MTLLFNFFKCYGINKHIYTLFRFLIFFCVDEIFTFFTMYNYDVAIYESIIFFGLISKKEEKGSFLFSALEIKQNN